MLHLDISNNQFGKEEFDLIAPALADNHTCYGFHNEGNYGETDSKMFMVEVEVPETQDEIDEKLEEDYKENKIDRKLKEIE